VVAGRLVTGDNACGIHVWEPLEGGKWAVDKNAPFKGHTSSVEDCQWSPAERDVFASCSADQTVCIWDCRTKSKPALRAKVHDADVNVMSWNRLANCMLATGADDGSLRIWDLRNFGGGAGGSASGAMVTNSNFVANFTFHRGPVTSVEWSRFDSAMLCTGSADHTVCVWDLAVERDAEEEAAAMAAADNAVAPDDLPPQLMFVHQGLKDPKEIHWHHQVPGMCVTTAADGFNAFKAYNVGNE
jgi:ribosome assembly protein RRB1